MYEFEGMKLKLFGTIRLSAKFSQADDGDNSDCKPRQTFPVKDKMDNTVDRSHNKFMYNTIL